MTPIIATALFCIATALFCVASVVSWVALSEAEKRHPYWNAVYVCAAVWGVTNGFAAFIIFQLGAALK